MENRRKDIRTFFKSFTITFCLLLAMIGFVIVDYQGRRMSFGDPSLPFQVVSEFEETRLEIRLFGNKTNLNVTPLKEMWGQVSEFFALT